MSKISTGRDPKKPNYIFQQSKPNSRLNGPISTDSFQNPQILRTIFSGHDVIDTPASFPVWGLLWQIVIIISFARERQTAPNDSNSSKPYQTEW